MIKLKAIAECSIQLEKARLDGGSGLLFGLLAYFITERGRPVTRSTLAEYFWWDRDRREASHCLRQAVYKLRRLGAPIETSGEHYMLGERAAVADFDCADERTLALSPLPPEEAVAVFPGFAPNASASFLTWLERTREKAGRSIRGVLVRALGDARRRNSWEEAAKLARQCLVLDPLNEEATLTLAEYTALQGDKREALRMIDGYIEEIGGTYADLRLPASLLRNRISERVAYPAASAAAKVPLIGREESLQVLANVAEQVNSGAGHTCVLHGPPGIGKTRLLTEFANISAMRGARIIRVECHADAIERPLAVFMELAPKLLRMPGALGCSPEALKLVKRLGSFDPNERLDPDEYGGAAFLHAAVRSSLRDLVDAIASERPLYLLVEDVHWIDRVSLEVLKELIGSNRERQLLVILSTRQERDSELLDGVDRRQLVFHEVPKLLPPRARALASAVCAALEIADHGELVEWCIARSDGNPLFVKELLSHWRETRDRSRIPISLEALIDERIAALGRPTLYVMQAIALLDEEAGCNALEVILEMHRWEVLSRIEELEKGGLVVARSERLAPSHSLLGDAALARMSAGTAATLHRAIAAYFSGLITTGPRDANLVWQAAYHWNASGANETALQLASSSARHMASIGAVQEAAALLEKAFLLCSSAEQELGLLNERRSYLEAAGAYAERRENCQRAMEIERAIAGIEGRVHSANEISYFMSRLTGEAADGVIAETLICINSEEASVDHRLRAATAGMQAAYCDSNAEGARAIIAAAAGIGASCAEERAHSLKTRMIYEYEFGDSARAVAASDEYLELCRGLNRQRLAEDLRIASYAHHLVGNFDLVHARLDEALAQARKWADPSQEARALEGIAQLFGSKGDYAAAMSIIGDLLDVFRRCPPAAQLTMRVTIAGIAALVGDHTLARTQLTRTEGVALTLHGQCDVLAARLIAASCRGDESSDEDLYDLQALNDRLEGRPGQQEPVAAIAMCLVRRGRNNEAAAVVTRYTGYTRRESWPSRHPGILASQPATHALRFADRD
jgi:tetratricopeptide (TPR) repeat protein